MRISRVFRHGRAVFAALTASSIVLAASARPAGQTAAQTPQTAPPAQNAAALPEARTIIDRHIEAIGGRKAILAHTSTRVTGTVTIPANGLSGTIEIIMAKPDLTRTKITFTGVGEMQEGYDGKVAWSMSPMTGPALVTGKELEQKKFDADFYGELHDPSRYESMTTVEQTTFAGRPSYKVRLVKKGGGEDIEFYDVASGLKVGGMATRESTMGALNLTQTFEDYKKVGELMHPMTLKVSTMGVDQVLTVTSVEYDKVDPSAFEPPPAIKALIK